MEVTIYGDILQEKELDELSCGWLDTDYLIGKRFRSDVDDLDLFKEALGKEDGRKENILQVDEITEEVDLRFVELYSSINCMFDKFDSFCKKTQTDDSEKVKDRRKFEFGLMDFEGNA